MRILFFFLDGVGLGVADPAINPFARAEMPNLQALLGGKRLVIEALSEDGNPSSRNKSLVTESATLMALDAAMGIPGLPQSATGQATLLTGINVPASLGYHYGPKPNQAVAEFLKNGNLFHTLTVQGLKATLLNAYPPGYFASIRSGRRIYSAIPLAVTSAGLRLKTNVDLNQGRALSADFTAQGWRDRLGLPETPILSPWQAGERMARLAREYDLAFFEYWLSDYAGHQQDMAGACQLLTIFDQVLGGLVEAWAEQDGLILITSDHGNLEDLSTRRHTANLVPGLLIGNKECRQSFATRLSDLTGVAPNILNCLDVGI